MKLLRERKMGKKICKIAYEVSQISRLQVYRTQRSAKLMGKSHNLGNVF